MLTGESVNEAAMHLGMQGSPGSVFPLLSHEREDWSLTNKLINRLRNVHNKRNKRNRRLVYTQR